MIYNKKLVNSSKSMARVISPATERSRRLFEEFTITLRNFFTGRSYYTRRLRKSQTRLDLLGKSRRDAKRRLFTSKQKQSSLVMGEQLQSKSYLLKSGPSMTIHQKVIYSKSLPWTRTSRHSLLPMQLIMDECKLAVHDACLNAYNNKPANKTMPDTSNRHSASKQKTVHSANPVSLSYSLPCLRHMGRIWSSLSSKGISITRPFVCQSIQRRSIYTKAPYNAEDRCKKTSPAGNGEKHDRQGFIYDSPIRCTNLPTSSTYCVPLGIPHQTPKSQHRMQLMQTSMRSLASYTSDGNGLPFEKEKHNSTPRTSNELAILRRRRMAPKPREAIPIEATETACADLVKIKSSGQKPHMNSIHWQVRDVNRSQHTAENTQHGAHSKLQNSAPGQGQSRLPPSVSGKSPDTNTAKESQIKLRPPRSHIMEQVRSNPTIADVPKEVSHPMRKTSKNASTNLLLRAQSVTRASSGPLRLQTLKEHQSSIRVNTLARSPNTLSPRVPTPRTPTSAIMPQTKKDLPARIQPTRGILPPTKFTFGSTNLQPQETSSTTTIVQSEATPDSMPTHRELSPRTEYGFRKRYFSKSLEIPKNQTAKGLPPPTKISLGSKKQSPKVQVPHQEVLPPLQNPRSTAYAASLDENANAKLPIEESPRNINQARHRTAEKLMHLSIRPKFLELAGIKPRESKPDPKQPGKLDTLQVTTSNTPNKQANPQALVRNYAKSTQHGKPCPLPLPQINLDVLPQTCPPLLKFSRKKNQYPTTAIRNAEPAAPSMSNVLVKTTKTEPIVGSPRNEVVSPKRIVPLAKDIEQLKNLISFSKTAGNVTYAANVEKRVPLGISVSQEHAAESKQRYEFQLMQIVKAATAKADEPRIREKGEPTDSAVIGRVISSETNTQQTNSESTTKSDVKQTSQSLSKELDENTPTSMASSLIPQAETLQEAVDDLELLKPEAKELEIPANSQNPTKSLMKAAEHKATDLDSIQNVPRVDSTQQEFDNLKPKTDLEVSKHQEISGDEIKIKSGNTSKVASDSKTKSSDLFNHMDPAVNNEAQTKEITTESTIFESPTEYEPSESLQSMAKLLIPSKPLMRTKSEQTAPGTEAVNESETGNNPASSQAPAATKFAKLDNLDILFAPRDLPKFPISSKESTRRGFPSMPRRVSNVTNKRIPMPKPVLHQVNENKKLGDSSKSPKFCNFALGTMLSPKILKIEPQLSYKITQKIQTQPEPEPGPELLNPMLKWRKKQQTKQTVQSIGAGSQKFAPTNCRQLQKYIKCNFLLCMPIGKEHNEQGKEGSYGHQGHFSAMPEQIELNQKIDQNQDNFVRIVCSLIEKKKWSEEEIELGSAETGTVAAEKTPPAKGSEEKAAKAKDSTQEQAQSKQQQGSGNSNKEKGSKNDSPMANDRPSTAVNGGDDEQKNVKAGSKTSKKPTQPPLSSNATNTKAEQAVKKPKSYASKGMSRKVKKAGKNKINSIQKNKSSVKQRAVVADKTPANDNQEEMPNGHAMLNRMFHKTHAKLLTAERLHPLKVANESNLECVVQKTQEKRRPNDMPVADEVSEPTRLASQADSTTDALYPMIEHIENAKEVTPRNAKKCYYIFKNPRYLSKTFKRSEWLALCGKPICRVRKRRPHNNEIASTKKNIQQDDTRGASIADTQQLSSEYDAEPVTELSGAHNDVTRRSDSSEDFHLGCDGNDLFLRSNDTAFDLTETPSQPIMTSNAHDVCFVNTTVLQDESLTQTDSQQMRKSGKLSRSRSLNALKNKQAPQCKAIQMAANETSIIAETLDSSFEGGPSMSTAYSDVPSSEQSFVRAIDPSEIGDHLRESHNITMDDVCVTANEMNGHNMTETAIAPHSCDKIEQKDLPNELNPAKKDYKSRRINQASYAAVVGTPTKRIGISPKSVKRLNQRFDVSETPAPNERAQPYTDSGLGLSTAGKEQRNVESNMLEMQQVARRYNEISSETESPSCNEQHRIKTEVYEKRKPQYHSTKPPHAKLTENEATAYETSPPCTVEGTDLIDLNVSNGQNSTKTNVNPKHKPLYQRTTTTHAEVSAKKATAFETSPPYTEKSAGPIELSTCNEQHRIQTDVYMKRKPLNQCRTTVPAKLSENLGTANETSRPCTVDSIDQTELNSTNEQHRIKTTNAKLSENEATPSETMPLCTVESTGPTELSACNEQHRIKTTAYARRKPLYHCSKTSNAKLCENEATPYETMPPCTVESTGPTELNASNKQHRIKTDVSANRKPLYHCSKTSNAKLGENEATACETTPACIIESKGPTELSACNEQHRIKTDVFTKHKLPYHCLKLPHAKLSENEANAYETSPPYTIESTGSIEWNACNKQHRIKTDVSTKRKPLYQCTKTLNARLSENEATACETTPPCIIESKGPTEWSACNDQNRIKTDVFTKNKPLFHYTTTAHANLVEKEATSNKTSPPYTVESTGPIELNATTDSQREKELHPTIYDTEKRIFQVAPEPERQPDIKHNMKKALTMDFPIICHHDAVETLTDTTTAGNHESMLNNTESPDQQPDAQLCGKVASQCLDMEHELKAHSHVQDIAMAPEKIVGINQTIQCHIQAKTDTPASLSPHQAQTETAGRCQQIMCPATKWPMVADETCNTHVPSICQQIKTLDALEERIPTGVNVASSRQFRRTHAINAKLSEERNLLNKGYVQHNVSSNLVLRISNLKLQLWPGALTESILLALSARCIDNEFRLTITSDSTPAYTLHDLYNMIAKRTAHSVFYQDLKTLRQLMANKFRPVDPEIITYLINLDYLTKTVGTSYPVTATAAVADELWKPVTIYSKQPNFGDFNALAVLLQLPSNFNLHVPLTPLFAYIPSYSLHDKEHGRQVTANSVELIQLIAPQANNTIDVEKKGVVPTECEEVNAMPKLRVIEIQLAPFYVESEDNISTATAESSENYADSTEEAPLQKERYAEQELPIEHYAYDARDYCMYTVQEPMEFEFCDCTAPEMSEAESFEDAVEHINLNFIESDESDEDDNEMFDLVSEAGADDAIISRSDEHFEDCCSVSSETEVDSANESLGYITCTESVSSL